ncbi:MAG: PKD domain-containing protein [bacterium]
MIVASSRLSWFGHLLLMLCCLLTACHSGDEITTPPTINAITPTGTIGKVGDSIDFHADVSGDLPLTFLWSLSGGGSITSGSTTADPTVSCTEAGDFTLSLTVTNDSGSDSASDPITIDPAIPVVQSVSPTGDVGKPAGVTTFEAAVTSQPTSWSWTLNLPGGPETFITETVELTLPNPGSYSGTVTATNVSGTSDPFYFVFNVSVPEAPAWAFHAVLPVSAAQITIVEHSGKLAVLSTSDARVGLQISLATTEIPASTTDWISHIIDPDGRTSGGHGQLVSIDGRLAVLYGNSTGSTLRFAIANVETPTSAADWTIYDLGPTAGFDYGDTMAASDAHVAVAYWDPDLLSGAFLLSTTTHPDSLGDWDGPTETLNSIGPTLLPVEDGWLLSMISPESGLRRSTSVSPTGPGDWIDLPGSLMNSAMAAVGFVEGQIAIVRGGPYQGFRWDLAFALATVDEPTSVDDWQRPFYDPVPGREAMSATLLEAAGRTAIFATILPDSQIYLLRSVKISVTDPAPWAFMPVLTNGTLDGGMDALVYRGHYAVAYYSGAPGVTTGTMYIAISDGLF